MSRLARAYLAVQRLRHAARGGWDAVQAGVWLGLMGRATLHALDDAVYAASRSYAGDRHNLRGLFDWEDAALRDHFAGCRSLLVVGAGGGREVLALARRGYRVEGHECNPALVEYAAGLLSREGCSAPVHFLPRDAAPAGPARFDGAAVGWTAYMLIAGRERRIAFLRGLRARLEPSAPVLLSFWTRREGSGRARLVAAVAGPLRRLARGEPPEAGDDLAPNFVHRFTRAEVEAELAAAGFRMVRFEPIGTAVHASAWAVGVSQPGPGASLP